MVQSLKNPDCAGKESFRPFELIGVGADDESLCTEQMPQHAAASLFGANPQNIEDIFPYNPLEEGVLALNVKRRCFFYISRNVMKPLLSTNISQFRESCETQFSDEEA